MRHCPDDLPAQAVHRGLAQLGIAADSLRYSAVGFGDHHWNLIDTHGARWFITVADLNNKPHCGSTPSAALAHLRRAMTTAMRLQDAGLDFVVAPVGAPLIKLNARYALSLFPEVKGTSGHFGQQITAAEHTQVQELLAHLHSSTVVAPETTMELPTSIAYLAGPAFVGQGAEAGPYSEMAHTLVNDHRKMIHHYLKEFELLTEELRGAKMVVTHGEPHPGNLIIGARCLHLLDWDTVGMAPPERDLSLLSHSPAELSHYERLTGYQPSENALHLYRLRWHLNDLAEFLSIFQASHVEDPDTILAWEYLQETIEKLQQM